MKSKNRHIILINIAINLVLILSLNIMLAFVHAIGFIAYMHHSKKYKKRNLKHKKFDIKYFRDDLKKISPAYISYLQDYDIELNRDVTAHILKLCIDKYVEVKNDKFILTDKDTSNLKKSDKLLLKYIEGNFKDLNFFDEYKKLVKEEMIEDGYISADITQKDILNLCSVFISSIIGIFALSFIRISFQIHVNSIVGVILVIGVVLFTISMLFSPVIFVSKLLAFRNHGMIKRTKKGEELLEQIYGLKNFLKDFSIIEDRKFEDVYLQEHYLVYAITLEVNTKVDDEILKKIKKQIK